MRVESMHEEQVIRFKGIFDGLAAERLRSEMAGADPGAKFHIDLSQVREFQDHAVATLAQAVSGRGTDLVAFSGLRQHQIRLLRYFGVDAAPFDAYTQQELG
jgi:hypothetical protein